MSVQSYDGSQYRCANHNRVGSSMFSALAVWARARVELCEQRVEPHEQLRLSWRQMLEKREMIRKDC